RPLRRPPVRGLRRRRQDAVGRLEQAVHRRDERHARREGPRGDPRGRRPRVRRSRWRVSQDRRGPLLREGARDLREGSGLMEVGMALAIKTLADDFQPLTEVYKSFVDEALIAEDLGFDYISTSEHHFEDDAWSPSQLPILANIAARTSRIRLHTNVFLLPLHQPLRVAEDASTVDILSNGRLDLVCGTGSVEEEFVAFGVDPRTRWSRFWEEMDILRLATAPEPFTFEGKHFSIPRPIRQTTQPVQQPFPLWVGGLGSKLQYNSGKHGFHSQGGPVFRPE